MSASSFQLRWAGRDGVEHRVTSSRMQVVRQYSASEAAALANKKKHLIGETAQSLRKASTYASVPVGNRSPTQSALDAHFEAAEYRVRQCMGMGAHGEWGMGIGTGSRIHSPMHGAYPMMPPAFAAQAWAMASSPCAPILTPTFLPSPV